MGNSHNAFASAFTSTPACTFRTVSIKTPGLTQEMGMELIPCVCINKSFMQTHNVTHYYWLPLLQLNVHVLPSTGLVHTHQGIKRTESLSKGPSCTATTSSRKNLLYNRCSNCTAVSCIDIRGHPVFISVTFNIATWSQGYSLQNGSCNATFITHTLHQIRFLINCGTFVQYLSQRQMQCHFLRKGSRP